MCRPSATRAREPKAIPPPISSTIIAEHRAMTAQALRSLLAWPAPRNTCECCSCSPTASAVALAVSLAGGLTCRRSHLQAISLEVAIHDVDQLIRGRGARLTSARPARHEVLADVILDDFRQQAAHGAAARGQQLHDLAAIRVPVERPLDRLELSAQAAQPVDQLGPVADGVRHGRLI